MLLQDVYQWNTVAFIVGETADSEYNTPHLLSLADLGEKIRPWSPPPIQLSYRLGSPSNE